MATEVTISETETFQLWEKLESLRQEIETKYDVDNLPRFNVNEYLDVFDKVYTEDGYVLDYIYHDSVAVYPLIYTRQESNKPVESLEDIKKLYSEPDKSIEHVYFEQSPSGYFQFAVFDIAVRQFFLFWHAKYNDLEVVSSRRQLDMLFDSPEKFHPHASADTLKLLGELLPIMRKRLDNISLQPSVVIDAETAAVTMVTFTKWGGFRFLTSHIRWPNRVESTAFQTIVPYHCLVRY
ncbi:MAG: hypothetical protein JXB30_06005 [Anaerolineae bacterium]|nr:hypothetical protein [Anaerolineae bacterium]